MNNTTYISTKEVAKLIREALRSEFPGVKFSVRRGTGTGSAWINVRYTDGPRSKDVDAITGRYQSRQFNGMTDGYDDLGSDLVAFKGDDLPTLVRFCCDGVNSHREISAEAEAWALELVKSTRRKYVMHWQDSDTVTEEMRHGDVMQFNGRAVPYYGGELRYYAQLVAHQFDLRDLEAVAL